MRFRRWPVAMCCAAAVVVPAGCQSSSDVRSVRAVDTARTDAIGAPDATDATDATDVDRRFQVESLGVAFDLAESFVEYEPDGLEFGARSQRPVALITIAVESGEYSHEPEEGEVISELTIDGRDAFEITNAHLDGLPPGIAAAELWVENGDRSFSVIMSGAPDDLPALWQEFIDSLTLLDDA